MHALSSFRLQNIHIRACEARTTEPVSIQGQRGDAGPLGDSGWQGAIEEVDTCAAQKKSHPCLPNAWDMLRQGHGEK